MGKIKDPTKEQIDEFVANMMQRDPGGFITYALCAIGKDMIRANAGTFEFSTEATMEDGKRHKITIRGKIKELKEN